MFPVGIGCRFMTVPFAVIKKKKKSETSVFLQEIIKEIFFIKKCMKK